MATRDHITPGSIEAERRLQGHSDHFYKVHVDIEGPVDELCQMSDLAMTWWDMLCERRGGHDLGADMIISERERRILTFALGNLWDRAIEIDKKMSAE